MSSYITTKHNTGHIETVLKEIITLPQAQENRILAIKNESMGRIVETDWELQRVEERKTRNKKSQADIDVVLDMRDKIRTDSDIAEMAVMTLTTIEEVKAFKW